MFHVLSNDQEAWKYIICKYHHYLQLEFYWILFPVFLYLAKHFMMCNTEANSAL